MTNWRNYCTNPVNYRPGGRKNILWLVWLKPGETGVLEANTRLAKPVVAATLANWFWQWPKWAALGAR